MPTSDGRASPEIKRKSTFQQELESTLKDRKRRGLVTGFSDTGDDDDDDDSSLEGGGANDDFLSQFSRKSKPSKSMTGSSKPWEPPSLGGRKESPKPSPRGAGSQSSPRNLGSLKLDSPLPTPRSRTRSIDKPDNLPTGKKSPSVGRKQSSPSPDPILALLGDSTKATTKRDMPKPKPRKRTSTGGSTDSPRSGEDLTPGRSESSSREDSSRPMPKPRGISPRSKGDYSAEVDRLFGVTHSKSASKQKTSDIDELLNIKSRDISPTSREGGSSPYAKILGKKKAKDKSSSPEFGRKSNSPEPKSKSRSPLDELLGNTGKQLLKEESKVKSPLLGKTKSRSKSSLDDLLNSGSKIKMQGGSPDISSERSPKSKIKACHGSPVSLSQKKRSPDQSDDDEERQQNNRTRKGFRESPGVNGKSGALVTKKTNGKESPATKQKTRLRKGLLDSSSESEEDTDARNTEQDRRKKSLPKPKPRVRTGKDGQRSSNRNLNSDSDLEEEDQATTKKGKLSLLEALGDGKDKGNNKKDKEKKKAMALLDNSDDEEEYEDVFGKQKNPPIISDRRPKEGYHSADSDGEDETRQKKRGSGPKLVKPTATRPMSATVGRGGTTASLNSSFNSNLSSLGRPGSTDIPDSSTIREAIFEDWKAHKTQELKQKKIQQRKKEKEEAEKKQREIKDKRREAESSFEAWKESKKGRLVEKKREEKRKKTKEKEEEEEKLMKKVHAKKAFEVWKEEKDLVLKDQHKKKQKQELMKTQSLAETKREKEKDAMSAFNRWKSDKDDYITEKVKAKKRKEQEKQLREEEARRQQEAESLQAYQDWEESVEQRKKQDRWRRMRTQPVSTAPFKPCSNTIPFGR